MNEFILIWKPMIVETIKIVGKVWHIKYAHMTAVIDYQPIIILNLLMGKVESPQTTKIIVEMDRRHLRYNKNLYHRCNVKPGHWLLENHSNVQPLGQWK